MSIRGRARRRANGAGARLSLKGVSAGYGPITVCRDIDLEVPAGTVMALLGANGAGKSTLLRALAGLIRSTGQIWLGETNLTRLSPTMRARAGMITVTDDRALFRELTVAENLQIGALLGHGSTKNPMRFAARFPVLESRGKTKAGLLSGGEQQMLAIAKALACRPSLLILDEPSQGLAPSVVAGVGRVLRTLKDENFSVLIAEQNLDVVSGIADRYATLSGGRIVDEGPIEELDREEMTKHFLIGGNS